MVHKNVGNITHHVSTFIIEKMDKRKKERLIKERFKVDYKHLSIYYSESDKGLLPITKDTLDQAIQLNENLFGSNYDQPYDILIFNNNSDIEDFCSLEYAIGCHSARTNTIGVLAENKQDIINNIEYEVGGYKKNFLHEYTHYVFTQKINEFGLTDHDIPLWFSEGLAEFIGYDNMDIPKIDAEFLPLQQLTTYKQWNGYRTDIRYDVYLQSYLAIKFLISKYGMDIINQILIETKLEGGFEEGFRGATGLNLTDFVFSDYRIQ